MENCSLNEIYIDTKLATKDFNRYRIIQHLASEDISVLSSVSLLFCHSVTAGPNIASAFTFIP